MRHGFVEPAQLLQVDAGVVPGFRVVAPDVDRLLKIRQRAGTVARGITSQAAVVEGRCFTSGVWGGMGE
jgi:hypothetical protein